MMPRLLADDDPRTPSALRAALETGEIVIFPTDTLYGIGGNPWDERSLDRVRRLKGRPPGQPFALHLPSCSAIGRYAALDRRLRRLIERLLPGPYTLLLPAGAGAPHSSVAEGRVGIRVPAHPFFQRTLAVLDRPLFGTSVNRHGEPPLNDVDSIIDRFPGAGLIITGPVGLSASSVLDLTVSPPRVLRGRPSEGLRVVLEEEESGDAADREQRPDEGPGPKPLLEDEPRDRQEEDR